MNPDYPGAIVVEANKYGYGGKPGALNVPRAWVLHTPEELADGDPQTPYYFHNTDRDASTTYFVSYLGFVFQCVPEIAGAYANAVEGKPYPAWADPSVNLNLQTLSIEIEGFASSIGQTMPRGSAQWKALVELMAHRCKALGIPPERTIGHYQVSVNRVDPGTLDIGAVIADVKARIAESEEDDMTPEECKAIVEAALKPVAEDLARVKKDVAQINQWLFAPGWIENPAPPADNHARQIAEKVK